MRARDGRPSAGHDGGSPRPKRAHALEGRCAHVPVQEPPGTPSPEAIPASPVSSRNRVTLHVASGLPHPGRVNVLGMERVAFPVFAQRAMAGG